MGELGEVLARAAGQPDDRVDVDDVRARLRRRRRRRLAGGASFSALLVALAAAGALALVGDRAPTEIVFDGQAATGPDGNPQLVAGEPVDPPPPGQAQPVWAPDGWPAFLANDGGKVHLLRARGAHRPGWAYAVAFCTDASVNGERGAFVDLLGNDIYSLDGDWAAGPGPTSLERYDLERHDDGRVVPGGDAHAPGRPVERGAGIDADHGDCTRRSSEGGPLLAFDPSLAVAPGLGGDVDLTTPDRAAARPEGTWSVVEGVLTTGEADRVRLCQTPDRWGCPPDSPVVGDVDGGVGDRGVWGRFLVRAGHDGLSNLIVVALAEPEEGAGEPAEDAGEPKGPRAHARPGDGEVVPITAPDGAAAFLVGDGDEVHTLRARSPMDYAAESVVWCPPAERFVSPVWRSQWTADGHYAAGPAAAGLVPYETTVDAGEVVVGAAARAPDRPAERSPAPAESVEACWDGPGRAAPETVAHFHPQRGEWPTIEDAIAGADGAGVVNARLTVTASSDHRRACHTPEGDPPRCPDDSPRVRSGDTGWLSDASRQWAGHARVLTDGDDVLRIVSWVAMDTLTEPTVAEQGRTESGDADRAFIDADRLIVPADDLFYGDAPTEPIPAGTYELTLTNHGDLTHTLVNDDLGVDLQVDGQAAGQTDSVRIHLPPGQHTFHCRIPGHREAGMELTLAVE